jgi:hypothetical protein
MMNLPLDQMSVEEKLELMEALWEDLSRNEAHVPSPAWHGGVLAEREAQIARGGARFLDWEQAKQQLRRETGT